MPLERICGDVAKRPGEYKSETKDFCVAKTTEERLRAGASPDRPRGPFPAAEIKTEKDVLHLP
jgi:hypothetical protein